MDASLETAPCIYFSMSENGEIKHANHLFCETVGKPESEVIGFLFDQFLSVPSRIAFQTKWQPMLHLQGYATEMRINLTGPAGIAVPVLLNVRTSKTEPAIAFECAGIAVHGRQRAEEDLTNAKKAYEAALSANVELKNARTEIERQVEELKATYSITKRQNIELKQINKIVTHDLQEPIRKILFNAERLGLLPGVLPPETEKLVNRIAGLTDNLRLKLRGLQDYIWLTEIDTPFEPVDLNKALATAVAKIGNQFGEEQLIVDTAHLPVISGDESMLTAMFYHLLKNAVTFKQQAPVAEVSIKSVRLAQNSLVNLSGRYDYKNYIRIDITDKGPGIDNSLSEKIFELFYKSEFSTGTGSGLALSKKIVEHHNGSIKATTLAGKGFQVSILLPAE